jgi:hypothetical protein
MAYVTYKNRFSSNYRFTCKSLDDPEIANLKEMLVKRNSFIYGEQKTQRLRIRPRGPRPSQGAYDTPWENATRYDVYIR